MLSEPQNKRPLPNVRLCLLSKKTSKVKYQCFSIPLVILSRSAQFPPLRYHPDYGKHIPVRVD